MILNDRSIFIENLKEDLKGGFLFSKTSVDT